jgi:hypothetical protein
MRTTEIIAAASINREKTEEFGIGTINPPTLGPAVVFDGIALLVETGRGVPWAGGAGLSGTTLSLNAGDDGDPIVPESGADVADGAEDDEGVTIFPLPP